MAGGVYNLGEIFDAMFVSPGGDFINIVDCCG
jgi:hypothetical protein